MKAKLKVGQKSPYGPNIVRAWFDTVFQYSLQGLETEGLFLKRRNWTYRFHGDTFECLGTVQDLVSPAAKVNLRQFTSFFPEVAAAIARHDGCVDRLLRDCRAFCNAILQNAHFREVFAAVAVEAPSELGREFQSFFGAYSSEEDFMGIIAEDLVNNIENLPGHYATAELWNRFRLRFVNAIATSELESFQAATLHSGQHLLEAVDELASLMEATRSELSLQFDVPIVVGTVSDR